MNVGEVFVRMALDKRDYEKGLNRMEGFTRQKALTLGSIFKGAFSFAIGVGIFQGFRSLGGAITDFVNTAARTEVLDVAMKSVARSSGYMLLSVQANKKEVMELGIAEQEATQILNRFMQAQLDTADAAKIARTAQDAAVIANENSSETALKMTEAIAKQRPELLAAYGMTKNLNDIYSDYAKTVGKTVKQLSETEKKQAMVNYILKEGEKIAGTYEASMGAVGKQLTSLPRLWDTLKNALAKPLALPAISVIVDGITNALKNAISWAEANKAALQMWGQTAADVASRVVEYFKWWYGVLIRNWQLIKVVTAALLAYATATKIAAAATTIFEIASSVLKGTIAANVPILGALSIAINTYRLQVALAPVATNIFTAALYRLQAAIYAVWTALGPVGWIILGISAAAGVGMHLWNKYTQSLQKAAQTASPADLSKGFRDLEQSTQKSADATEEQADALGKAGKAAGKNLQSFDEIHQLQGDMAGADMPELDLEGLDIDTEFPAMDFAGMFAGLDDLMDMAQGTLSGFWDWIKESVKKFSGQLNELIGLSLWELITIATGPLGMLVVLFARHWDDIKEAAGIVWGAIWELLKTYWGNTITLAKDVFGGIWDFIVGTWENIRDTAVTIWGAIWGFISGTWENIKNTAVTIWNVIWGFLKSQWETIKEFGGNMFGILGDLITGKIDLRTAVKLIWSEIKKFFIDTWNNIKTLGEGVWSALTLFLTTQWELVKTTATTIWNAIKKFFETQWGLIKTLAATIWNTVKRFFSDNWEATKKTASTIWTAIKNLISKVWDDIKNVVSKMATQIFKLLGINWEETKKAAKEKWEGVKRVISDKWQEIKDDAFNWGRKIITAFTDGIKDRISKIKTTFSSVAGTIKDYLGFSSPTKEGPGRYADQWAPNLISMYSKGLTDNISMMQDAASTTIRGLTELDIGGAAIAGKQAGVSQPAFAPAPTASSGDMTLIVKIGEDTIMERVISNINRRSRISGETVIIT